MEAQNLRVNPVKRDLFNIKIELEDEGKKAKPTTLAQHFAACVKYIKALNLRLHKYVSQRVYYFFTCFSHSQFVGDGDIKQKQNDFKEKREENLWKFVFDDTAKFQFQRE